MKTSSIQSTLYSPSYATLNSAVTASDTGNLTQYRADGAVQPISTQPPKLEKNYLKLLSQFQRDKQLNVYAQAQQNPSQPPHNLKDTK